MFLEKSTGGNWPGLRTQLLRLQCCSSSDTIGLRFNRRPEIYTDHPVLWFFCISPSQSSSDGSTGVDGLS